MNDQKAFEIAATLPPAYNPENDLPTHSLNILDKTGHHQSIWDPNNAIEVETARTTFNTLKSKGYVAYRVQANGEKGEVMKDFDPAAKAVIMTPAVAGG